MNLHNVENLMNSVIGPYTLIRLIARGGMGSVYLAQEQALGRYVALKVLDADAANDSEFAARFRREGPFAEVCVHSNGAPRSPRLTSAEYFTHKLLVSGFGGENP